MIGHSYIHPQYLLQFRGLTVSTFCRIMAMYDSSTGTERFCIRQLLKPLENVSQCIRDVTCMLSDGPMPSHSGSTLLQALHTANDKFESTRKAQAQKQLANPSLPK